MLKMKMPVVCLISLTCVFSLCRQAEVAYYRLVISHFSARQLEEVKREVIWWVELDRTLLVLADAAESLAKNYEKDRLPVSVNDAYLGFVNLECVMENSELGCQVLAKGGRWAVVMRQPDEPSLKSKEVSGSPVRIGDSQPSCLLPFLPNTVLASERGRSGTLPTQKIDGDIQTIVDEVDADRWFADIETLASWDRYTYGSEIDLAGDWLAEQFEAMQGMSVEKSNFSIGDTQTFNVVGTLRGTESPDKWIVIGAHYDAKSEIAFLLPAPGAEDNASGTAAVLEMARIFSAYPPKVTLKFICYSGEEQGLWGSEHHVALLQQSGDAEKIRGFLTMDMVGFTADEDLDCLLESNRASEETVDLFAQAAATYTDLRIVTSFFPFGSDHMPYLNAGMMGLLVIENDWDIYPYYHTSGDTPEHISLPMGREILEMNVAAVATLIDTIESMQEFTYYLPHIPPADAWQVQVGISNLSSSQTAHIVQTTYELLADQVDRVFQARFSLTGGASTSLQMPGESQRWTRLRSTTELSGLATFALDRGRGIEKAALPMMTTGDLQPTLVFPHVPADRGQFWSGAAFFNPHDELVSYQIHLYHEGHGNLDELLNPIYSGPLTLSPRQKQVVIFQTTDQANKLFDDVDSDNKVSWVEIETDGTAIGGFELFGKTEASGSTGELASIPCMIPSTSGPLAIGLNRDAGDLDYRGFSMLNARQQSTPIDMKVFDWAGTELFDGSVEALAAGEKLLGLNNIDGFFFPYGTATGIELTEPHIAYLDPAPPILFELSGIAGETLDGVAGLKFGSVAHFGGIGVIPKDSLKLHLMNSGHGDQALELTLFDAAGEVQERRTVALAAHGGVWVDLTDHAASATLIRIQGSFEFSGYLAITDSSASDRLLLLAPVIE